MIIFNMKDVLKIGYVFTILGGGGPKLDGRCMFNRAREFPYHPISNLCQLVEDWERETEKKWSDPKCQYALLCTKKMKKSVAFR